MAGLPTFARVFPLAAMRWLRARLRALLAGKGSPVAGPPAADPWATKDGRPRNRFNPWE